MSLRGWFRSKKEIVQENKELKDAFKVANIQVIHLKNLLDHAAAEMRRMLDKTVKDFAMIRLERDVLRTERDNALVELHDLKRGMGIKPN